jgi:hypothetical protein
LRRFDQFTGRAVWQCPELGKNCSSEAEEIGQLGVFAGYPSAAEKQHSAFVASRQELVGQ